MIEERRGADDSVLASYVHGAYIDDVVTMRRAVPQGGIPADWFFHSDDQFSVSAVTNAAGALAERVAYGDFGAPTFFTPGGSAMVASAIGNPYAFTGRRWDAAERTYHYRFRTFSPGLGRFTTRDPIGIWGDALNLGNGYTYTGNDPWSWVDPWRLSSLWSRCPTFIQDYVTTKYFEEDIPELGQVTINYAKQGKVTDYTGEFDPIQQQLVIRERFLEAQQNLTTTAEAVAKDSAVFIVLAMTLVIPGPEDVIVGVWVFRGGKLVGRIAGPLARRIPEGFYRQTNKQLTKTMESLIKRAEEHQLKIINREGYDILPNVSREVQEKAWRTRTEHLQKEIETFMSDAEGAAHIIRSREAPCH